MFIWTLFGTHDVPTQLWVSRDLDKQGNFALDLLGLEITSRHQCLETENHHILSPSDIG